MSMLFSIFGIIVIFFCGISCVIYFSIFMLFFFSLFLFFVFGGNASGGGGGGGATSGVQDDGAAGTEAGLPRGCEPPVRRVWELRQRHGRLQEGER